jgi:Uma2 family endonuclease
MATRPRLTAEDLWKMGESDARRELVNGEIVEMSPPGSVHGQVAAALCQALREHARRSGAGVVFVETGFVLDVPGDRERVRAPDVSYVRSERLPGGRVPEGFFPGAPDLAAEVLSPDDRSVDVEQRVRDSLDGGSRLVWVIAPRTRTATTYRPDGSARLLRAHEALDGEDVLPGLRVPLADLFA